ncbi:Chaperone DnaJ-domain superfamily protein isoform 1 [Hibiscus syriacus]|uniref:Chaperone DnaJ-domain superfamily protein isoform 1 n=1 Tax=Hibiscus syriacus TaxID=106335 RepID=A0A6A3C5Y6_HIBSY|nr:Chaperone DnaJ-domain superfamily protein isoform 1 [Hibiscus syriacus]
MPFLQIFSGKLLIVEAKKNKSNDNDKQDAHSFIPKKLKDRSDSSDVSELGRLRHYEVVYLIHEKHDEGVEKVNEKVQDFLREKKGRVWRLNDWGLRRLAYKIKKAKNATTS